MMSISEIFALITCFACWRSEQLREIATALKEDYARKDVINPQIEALRNEVKNLKEQIISTPQKLLMYAGSIAALIWTLYNILHSMK